MWKLQSKAKHSLAGDISHKVGYTSINNLNSLNTNVCMIWQSTSFYSNQSQKSINM